MQLFQPIQYLSYATVSLMGCMEQEVCLENHNKSLCEA